jgi:hypothetical protein
MNTCTYAHKEVAFQFFNVDNKAYFPYLVGGDTLKH